MNGWASLTPAYTLSTPKSTSNTAYASNYDVIVDGITWNAPGNQNFTGYWRIGGAKGTNITRTITGKGVLTDVIKKITVNHSGVSNASLTINSVTLTVASNSDFSTIIDTKVLTPSISTTAGSFDYTPTSPLTQWAANSYYKFTIVYTHSANSNYGLNLASIVFYKEVSGEIATVSFADDAPSVVVGDTYTNTPTKTPAALAVTFASDKTDIATVDENTGEVTGVAPGKARITASWAAQTVSATDYAAGSAYYDIIVKGPIVDGEFDFGVNQDYGSGAVASTNSNNTTQTTWTAGCIVMDIAGRNVWYNGVDLRLYSNSAGSGNPSNAGNITISAPTGYYITKVTGLSSGNLTANVGTKISSGVWAGKSQSVIFTHTGASGTITINKIKVYYTNVGTVGITMGEAGYMTYCFDNANLSFGDGVEAYVASAVGGDNVTLTKVSTAPAGTPLVLKATAGAHDLTIAESAASVGTNNLKVSNGTSAKGDDIYVLAKPAGKSVGFYKWASASSLSAGKIYLKLPAGAREFLGFDFDDATGIEGVTKTQKADGLYFNLAGQRVAQPAKGLYIVNGKKVIIK